jgi:hypothetical protein
MAKPQITVREGPRVVSPMNARGGLYIQLHSAHGYLTSDQILKFCVPLAREHGYNPNGDGMVGMPCGAGIKALTYAVWFYDRVRT